MNISFTNTNLTFCSTGRFYKAKDGDEFGCNSWLFRDDMDWKKLAEYEITHFKDKEQVNTLMFAASDGSEAYTNIISLYENSKAQDDAKKFFPIMAYDLDDEIVKAAKSGYIKTCLNDRMQLQMKCNNYEDYFENTDKKLEIAEDKGLQREKTFKVKDILTKNVNFHQGDMFEKIQELKDNSNTVLMCRNILGYFLDDKIEEFIQSAAKFLKSGSLFAIGNHDTRFFDIKSCMEHFGFKQIFHNLYEKI